MSDIVSDYNPFSYPICNSCKHHISGDKCKAFDKIPDDIIFDRNNHSKIYPGQKGDYVFFKED